MNIFSVGSSSLELSRKDRRTGMVIALRNSFMKTLGREVKAQSKDLRPLHCTSVHAFSLRDDGNQFDGHLIMIEPTTTTPLALKNIMQWALEIPDYVFSNEES